MVFIVNYRNTKQRFASLYVHADTWEQAKEKAERELKVEVLEVVNGANGEIEYERMEQ